MLVNSSLLLISFSVNSSRAFSFSLAFSSFSIFLDHLLGDTELAGVHNHEGHVPDPHKDLQTHFLPYFTHVAWNPSQLATK